MFKDYVISDKMHIVCLSKTGLSDKASDETLDLKNYKL